jgi:hypothetical protein
LGLAGRSSLLEHPLVVSMARGKRRKKGGPEYPLAAVHTLARLSLIHVTKKARDEAATLLPKSIAMPAAAIRQTLLALTEENWRFAEQNENGWVDVYRILKYNRLIWTKLKIEWRNARETVILLSFHDYDDDVPI